MHCGYYLNAMDMKILCLHGFSHRLCGSHSKSGGALNESVEQLRGLAAVCERFIQANLLTGSAGSRRRCFPQRVVFGHFFRRCVSVQFPQDEVGTWRLRMTATDGIRLRPGTERPAGPRLACGARSTSGSRLQMASPVRRSYRVKRYVLPQVDYPSSSSPTALRL